MVPKFVCVWLLVSVAVGDGAEETKRDKRTVDILLRGAADLFGYDVVRRIGSPSLRQVALTPRPTFFPPPVAPQLPPGSYSRIIFALGQQQQEQQQQEQQQQLQRRLEQAFPVPLPQAAPQAALQAAPQPQAPQQTVINIPQNGALTASAEAIHFPQGGLFPIFQASAPAEQAPLLSALRATLTAAAPASQSLQVQQAAPAPQQAPSAPQQAPSAPQQAPPAQQAAPAAPPQTTAQQSPPNDGSQQQSFGIPLQIVAIAPAQSFSPSQSQASESQAQSSPQQSAQQSVPTPAPPAPSAQISPSAAASPANSAGPQQAPSPQQPNAFNLVLDQGPTRWNLFSLPRQESVRRSLSLNLNWNRNDAPESPAQLQLVPVPLETTPTPPQQVAHTKSIGTQVTIESNSSYTSTEEESRKDFQTNLTDVFDKLKNELVDLHSQLEQREIKL